MPRTGCGWRAPCCKSARATTRSARCCSIAPRPPPTSPINAPPTAISKPTASPCSAARSPTASNGGRALDALRLSLDLRETADLRGQYERLRVEHGFRYLDYSVDSDAVSPRACFQFSEELPGRRTDFSPYVAVAGVDKPAISANDKQLCVEGLKHGERYTITLRAGLPSVVRETLAKTAEFTIFVRDRKPFARFSGKAYVLPRTGQRGIPVLSVNTAALDVSIYRIGDRNLIETVLGYDFQRNISRSDAERITSERGEKVWSGELTVEQKLNTEVTTAFPVEQALKDIGPGVYAITATPKDLVSDDYEQQATQWFIVSDLGLTAYSGQDGIDVFIHSLASAEPKAGTNVRLIARNNEVLATKPTDPNGFVHFEAGLARGEGGLSPAAIVASDKADYAFLSLKSPAFDLSDRGVAGRPVPEGLDAFVYTERGVYRTGEAVEVTALLRDARGVAATAVPLTLVVERPDGVEYRRVMVPDQGLGGRSLHVPIVSTAATGTWRVRAYTDPKRPPIGETTFMVEDYVADRIEFDLASAAKVIAAQRRGASQRRRSFPLWRAGVQSRTLRRGDHRRRQRAAGLCRLFLRAVRRRSDGGSPGTRRPAGDRCRRQSEFPGQARQGAGDVAAARSADHREHGGIRRPRRRAQADAAGGGRCGDDRRQAGLLRPLARRRRQCRFRRGDGGARRQQARARTGCATNCSRSRPAINGIARTANGISSRSSAPNASPTARSTSPPTSRRGCRCR